MIYLYMAHELDHGGGVLGFDLLLGLLPALPALLPPLTLNTRVAHVPLDR